MRGYRGMTGKIPNDTSQLQLTFGIELEGQIRNDGSGLICNDDISSILKEAGFAARASWEEHAGSYDKWELHKDLTIYEDARTNSFELVSRTLPATGVSYQEVRGVIDTLHENFRICTDSSTAFHVHVGNGHLGLPLRTLLNISIIGTAFQGPIDSLHNPNRVTDLFGRRFARPITDVETMRSATTIYARVTLLLTATSWDQLLRLSQDSSFPMGDKYFAYNFLPMLSLRTVEFRQHTGTFEVDAIISWCKFVTGLVEFAHYADAAAMATLLSHVGGQGFGPLELLNELGMGELREYYSGRLYDHSESTPTASSTPDPEGFLTVLAALSDRESLMSKNEAIRLASGEVRYNDSCIQCDPNYADPWLPWAENPFDKPRLGTRSDKGNICESCEFANAVEAGFDGETVG